MCPRNKSLGLHILFEITSETRKKSKGNMRESAEEIFVQEQQQGDARDEGESFSDNRTLIGEEGQYREWR